MVPQQLILGVQPLIGQVATQSLGLYVAVGDTVGLFIKRGIPELCHNLFQLGVGRHNQLLCRRCPSKHLVQRSDNDK